MKIIICFDGTSKQPEDAHQEKTRNGLLEDDNITNVLKLHLLAGGNIENTAAAVNGQKSLYYSGVGTRGNFFRRILRQAFALSSPEDIMAEALDDLAEVYTKGDHLYIFGFSRGAAIARLFTSILARDGLKTRDGDLDRKPVVKMLGVWDTVASFGAPNLDSEERPVSDVLFEDCIISPIIENAYHAVALDENRLAFRPTLMSAQPNVHEVWFPGTHSDIGGGFRIDGLSDICLKWMIVKAYEHGLDFLSAAIIPEENLHGRDQDGDQVHIGRDDIEINPNPDCNALLHAHNDAWRKGKLADMTLAPRDVVVLKGNQVSDLPPAIHTSAIDRLSTNNDYNPNSALYKAYRTMD